MSNILAITYDGGAAVTQSDTVGRSGRPVRGRVHRIGRHDQAHDDAESDAHVCEPSGRRHPAGSDAARVGKHDDGDRS